MGIGSAVAVGVSAISGARQAKASGKASVADIKQQGLATQKNIENRAEAVRFSQGVSEQRLGDMDIALSDKMSQTGLESLKREARLKAASAETGTSGGTTTSVVKDTRMQQSLNNAMTIRQARNSKLGILRQMSTDKLSLDNQLTSLASGITSPFAAGLSTMNAGMAGYQNGMNFMNQVEQERYYGYNTQTKPKYQG